MAAPGAVLAGNALPRAGARALSRRIGSWRWSTSGWRPRARGGSHRPASAPIGTRALGHIIVASNEASSILCYIGRASKGTTLSRHSVAAAAEPKGLTPCRIQRAAFGPTIVVAKDLSSGAADLSPESRRTLAPRSAEIGVIEVATGASAATTPAITDANTGKGVGSVFFSRKRQTTTDISPGRNERRAAQSKPPGAARTVTRPHAAQSASPQRDGGPAVYSMSRSSRPGAGYEID